MRQDMAKDEAARQTREDGPAVVLFDLGPRNFHQLAVFDARGARRLARAAVQAPIDVPDERNPQPQLSLIDQQHLPAAPAPRIGLEPPLPISRAMVQAEAAVNAARV